MLLLTAARRSETFLSGGGDCIGEKLIGVKQGFSLLELTLLGSGGRSSSSGAA
jgi:hypothetical protein